MMTAQTIVEAAQRRAAEIVAAAEAQAEALVAGAQASAGSVRTQAHSQGLETGRALAMGEMDQVLSLLRQAAAEGKQVRDDIAAQSAGVIARATALATRRIVGEYYEADPARTATAVAEAMRAASGQEILSIRVHPGLVGHVQASLGDASKYVRPDDGIAVGGCVIDLRHGTLDAALDSRLSLTELALVDASGEGAE
jgi:flagellar biosynthesis/type III secretory pathway protein FliH